MSCCNVQSGSKLNIGAAPVIGQVTTKEFGTLPLVAVPMMSDYKWQLKALEDRLVDPEKYRAIGENVEEATAQLREWLEEHREAAGAAI